MSGAALSPPVAAEARRILDSAARRLLATRLDGDAIGSATGTDDGAVHDRADEGASLLKRQNVPVTSANGDRGRGGGY